jgi:hypothetical protein
MLSLSRKKIIVFLLVSTVAQAQVKTKHQPNYDAKPLRFGYYIGMGSTHYITKYKDSFFSPENENAAVPIYGVTSPNATTIRAGAMINYYLNDYFDVRFSPLNLSIQKRNLTYIEGVADNLDEGTPIKVEQVDKAWLEIPFHVKYKSERRFNSRMYVFGGARMAFETNTVGRRGSKRTSGRTSMRSADFLIEYGAGLEIFRPYFKVTPEIHFSHGLFDMIRNNNTDHHLQHVKSLRTHMVSLLILFQ